MSATVTVTEPSRQTPVYGEFDVVVVGAGPAPWRTVERLMAEAEAAGTHTFPRKKPIVRPQRNPLEWRANLTQLRTADGGAIDGADVDQLTLGELTGRQQALGAFSFIRDRTPGFEDSYIVDIAPQIVPEGVRNLYVAGRCASMTHGAQSAARVTGPCFVMGEAAGTAAGLALDADGAGDQIDVAELQRRLENHGAFLGRTAPEPIT